MLAANKADLLWNYRLAGRGTVEITIEKGDGSTFSAEAGGDQRKSATIQVSKLILVKENTLFLYFYPTVSRAVHLQDTALLIIWI